MPPRSHAPISKRRYVHPVQSHVSDEQLLWLYSRSKDTDTSVATVVRDLIQQAMESPSGK